MSALRAVAFGVLTGALGAVANGCFGVRAYPGPALCSSVADCDDGSPCTIDWCIDGACEHTPVEGISVDDDNACTKDSCAGGMERHEPITKPTMCGEGVGLSCDKKGACTGCVAAGQCGNDTPCRTWACNDGACVAVAASAGTGCSGGSQCDGRGQCAGCDDGVQNGGETDIDCGGPCVLSSGEGTCASGQHCDDEADCAASTTCNDHVCCGAACAP